MSLTADMTRGYENTCFEKQSQNKPNQSQFQGVPLGWIILLMKLENQCKLFSKKKMSEKPDEKVMGKCCSV